MREGRGGMWRGLVCGLNCWGFSCWGVCWEDWGWCFDESLGEFCWGGVLGQSFFLMSLSTILSLLEIVGCFHQNFFR